MSIWGAGSKGAGTLLPGSIRGVSLTPVSSDGAGAVQASCVALAAATQETKHQGARCKTTFASA